MKTVLVTGGARGIGQAIVERFAQHNYTVIVNYNNSEQQAYNLRQELQSKGYDVHIVKCDVSCESDVVKMIDFVKKYFKKLDVLVNNAGVALYNMLEQTTSEQYDKVMNINVKGAFLVTKYCLPLLRKSNSTPHIVNVSSIWGLDGASCESIYSMSKFAIVGLTKSLALELQDICVNCVCPSIVLTDMTANLSQSDIDSFCNNHNCQVVQATSVADKIIELVDANNSGQIVRV